LTSRPSSLIETIRRHPFRVIALTVCVIAGGALGAAYLPDSLSMPRRVVGGALLGGLSWLIPSFGRIIGED